MELARSRALVLLALVGAVACSRKKEVVEAATTTPATEAPSPITVTVRGFQLTLSSDWAPVDEHEERLERAWWLKRDLHDPKFADVRLYKGIELASLLETARRLHGEDALRHVLEDLLQVVADAAIREGDKIVSQRVVPDGFYIETLSHRTQSEAPGEPSRPSVITELERVLVVGARAEMLTCRWGTFDPDHTKPEDEAKQRERCAAVLDSFRKSG